MSSRLLIPAKWSRTLRTSHCSVYNRMLCSGSSRSTLYLPQSRVTVHLKPCIKPNGSPKKTLAGLNTESDRRGVAKIPRKLVGADFRSTVQSFRLRSDPWIEKRKGEIPSCGLVGVGNTAHPFGNRRSPLPLIGWCKIGRQFLTKWHVFPHHLAKFQGLISYLQGK